MRANKSVWQKKNIPAKAAAPLWDTPQAAAWRTLILDNAPLRRPLRILDVNAGSGLISLALSLDGNLVSGLCEDTDSLSCAKKARAPEIAEPDFFLAEEADFKDEIFDLVIARDALCTRVDRDGLLSEIKRLLKPNGTLMIFEADYAGAQSTDSHFAALSEKTRKISLSSKAEANMPYSEYIPYLLGKNGFKEISSASLRNEELFFEEEKEFYRQYPLYFISAKKAVDTDEEEESLLSFCMLRQNSRVDRTIKDLHSFKRRAWGDMLVRYAPKRKRALRVLDVGCGSGFLSITASQCGWEVTGVDISNAKISAAIDNAANMRANVNFICAEADELPFDSEQFDLVIHRNVLWNLPNPERAYAEWYRVLGKSGRLVYFDGEWQKQPMDEPLEYFDFGRRQAREKSFAGYYDDEVFSAEIGALKAARNYLFDKKRPEWDRQMLPKWGLVPLAIRCDVSDALWDDYERGLYFMTPLFVVVAEKMKRPTI